MYGRVDGVPHSLQPMVVCSNYSLILHYYTSVVGIRRNGEKMATAGVCCKVICNIYHRCSTLRLAVILLQSSVLLLPPSRVRVQFASCIIPSKGRYKASNLYSSSILRRRPQDSTFSRKQSKYSLKQPHPHSYAKQKKQFTSELTKSPLLSPKQFVCTQRNPPYTLFPR